MKAIDCRGLELRKTSGARISPIVAASAGDETLDPAGVLIPVSITIEGVARINPGERLTVWDSASDQMKFGFQVKAVEMLFVEGQTVIEGENFISKY